MLKLRRTRRTPTESTDLLDRPDLQIRNLLDDPRLRRSMGLDEPTGDPLVRRPEPRFDRRRLLDGSIA